MSAHKFRLAVPALVTLAALAAVPGSATSEKRDDKQAKTKDDKPAVASSGIEVRNALRKTIDFPTIDDPKTTLAEALEMLSKMSRVIFDVDDKAFKYEMVNAVLKEMVADPQAVPPMPQSLVATVLKKILSRVPVPSGATFLIRNDHVEITTRDAVRRELRLDRRDVKAKGDAQSARPALSPLVWEQLDRVPVEKALRDIADDTGVNVILDPRADRAYFEVTATLRNVPVDAAIEVLADLVGLSVVYRENVIYVTTAENARRLLDSKRWSAEPQRLAEKVAPAGDGM